MTNSLINWNDWSVEAFKKAEQENKLVFLNIKVDWAATCRFMEQDTFSDKVCAQLINELFVPIRVDSDMRPDINARYNMGEWPSTLFLTPEGMLIWGSTYVANDEMRSLLQQMKVKFSAHREKIYQDVREREKKIRSIDYAATVGKVKLSQEVFRSTLNGILSTYDYMFGGFGKAPKFPMCDSIRVVLNAFWETGGPDFHQILTHTIDALTTKSLRDAVDGGYFRYATNDTWTAVEFEKITADNCAIAMLLLDAYSLTGVERYRDIANKDIEFLFRFLFDKDRFLFYSSLGSDEKYYSAKDRSKVNLPAVDTRVFLETNCIASRLLLKGSTIINDQLAQVAEKNLDNFMSNNDVYHVYLDKPYFTGLLRNEISLLTTLVDAYEILGKEKYLQHATKLADRIIEKYRNNDLHGFQDKLSTKDDIGELKYPRKEINENSKMCLVLAKLSHILSKPEYLDIAKNVLSNFPDYMGNYGHQTALYSMAVDFCVKSPVYFDVKDRFDLASLCNSIYIPLKVVRWNKVSSTGVTITKDNNVLGNFNNEEDLVNFLKDF